MLTTTVIIAKRHKYKFYFSIGLVTLMFLAMAIGALFVSFKTYGAGLRGLALFMLGMAVLLVLFTVYSIYQYFKSAPVFSVDKQGISFKDRAYSWKELEHIELTGKQGFRYFISFPMEASTLHFSDGKSRILFDDMYANSPEIKRFLKNVVMDKKLVTPDQNKEASDVGLEFESFEVFKNSPWSSARGLSLWGLLLFLLYMSLTKNKIPFTWSLSIFGFFGLFWFLFSSYMMHYFACSDRYLVVKNHNFVWKKEAYLLKDIQEVVFETQPRSPNFLRVITTDFRNKTYPAGTLQDGTWLALKAYLERRKVPVRNECIPEN